MSCQITWVTSPTEFSLSSTKDSMALFQNTPVNFTRLMLNLLKSKTKSSSPMSRIWKMLKSRMACTRQWPIPKLVMLISRTPSSLIYSSLTKPDANKSWTRSSSPSVSWPVFWNHSFQVSLLRFINSWTWPELKKMKFWLRCSIRSQMLCVLWFQVVTRSDSQHQSLKNTMMPRLRSGKPNSKVKRRNEVLELKRYKTTN